MFSILPSERFNLIESIDNNIATKIPAASFRDGDANEFIFNFYKINNRIFRSCYNIFNTITTFHELSDEELDLFYAHYPLARTTAE